MADIRVRVNGQNQPTVRVGQESAVKIVSSSSGSQGIQGSQGSRGLDGLFSGQGTQGIQGLQGNQGTQGLSGSFNVGSLPAIRRSSRALFSPFDWRHFSSSWFQSA